MQIEFENSPLEKIAADALAVICFESEEKAAEGSAVAPSASSDPAVAAQSGWLAELRETGEFTGKLYEMATLYRPEGVSAKRLVVVGGGKRGKFTAFEARRLAGVLVRNLKPRGIRTIALTLNENVNPEVAEAVAEGAILGEWEADKYKSDPKKNEK